VLQRAIAKRGTAFKADSMRNYDAERERERNSSKYTVAAMLFPSS